MSSNDEQPTTQDNGGMGLSKVITMVCGVVALFVVCCTVLLCFSKDIGPLIQVGNLIVLPLISMLGIKAYQSIKGDMASVKVDVNGRLSKLVDHAINSVPLDKVEGVKHE